MIESLPKKLTIELIVVLLAYYLIELLVLICHHVPQRVLLLLVETLHELPLGLADCKLMPVAGSQDIGSAKLRGTQTEGGKLILVSLVLLLMLEEGLIPLSLHVFLLLNSLSLILEDLVLLLQVSLVKEVVGLGDHCWHASHQLRYLVLLGELSRGHTIETASFLDLLLQLLVLIEFIHLVILLEGPLEGLLEGHGLCGNAKLVL